MAGYIVRRSLVGRRRRAWICIVWTKRRIPPHARVPSIIQPFRSRDALRLHATRLAHRLTVLLRPFTL